VRCNGFFDNPHLILKLHYRAHRRFIGPGGFPTIQIISLKVIICHKNDLSTLLLCDDLSDEDQDNISTIKEIGGSIL
jgi:hypothetical protein